MKPLTNPRPGLRIRAFQGPNAGRWGTILHVHNNGHTVSVRWDDEGIAPTPSAQSPLCYGLPAVGPADQALRSADATADNHLF